MFTEFLTATIDFVVLAFVVVVFDFCSGLSHLWKSVVPALQEKPLETPQQLELQPDLVVVEDPWLLDVAPCIERSCHPVTNAPMPLLLPPAQLITESLDLTSMPAVALRKLCTQRGIKWRHVHGTKHLSKVEMIIMLTA